MPTYFALRESGLHAGWWEWDLIQLIRWDLVYGLIVWKHNSIGGFSVTTNDINRVTMSN